MSKPFRLILFLIFLFAFLISAPLIVLYTAGYRFDLSHGRIVHTAILNISSIPRNAMILIDTLPSTDRTPAVINTIVPGEHLITLQKTGYLPWETSLSFLSREARILNEVVLFLDKQPEQEKMIGLIDLSINPKTDSFAYITQESSWLEVWRVHVEDAQKKLLMRLPYDSESTYDLSWSSEGTFLSLERSKESHIQMTISHVSNGELIELPQTEDPIDRIWWDAGKNDQLYLLSKEKISRFSLSTRELTPLNFKASAIISHSEKEITVSQANNKEVISYQDGATASIITYLPLGEYTFVETPKNLIGLHNDRQNRLILIDPVNKEQPILFDEEASLWKWNASGDILLYSSGYDIKRYVQTTHQTDTLVRLSRPITHLDWYPEGNTAIYQSDGTTTALTLDGARILSQTILLKDLPGIFWIDRQGTTLHLFQQSSSQWDWYKRPLQN
ncbi:PEGA domain-containing protein [Candidatus Uhrbacteria bacterium]|nr:PEGA domain-containing protein [Candidatus Uhrbacteria bacterium]